MPKLISLYIRQIFLGFGLSAVFVTLLLYLNVANLWHLVTHTSGGIVAVIMLFMFNGIVFAGVQFSITIMRMAGSDDLGGGKRQPVTDGEMAPVRVAEEKPDRARRYRG